MAASHLHPPILPRQFCWSKKSLQVTFLQTFREKSNAQSGCVKQSICANEAQEEPPSELVVDRLVVVDAVVVKVADEDSVGKVAVAVAVVSAPVVEDVELRRISQENWPTEHRSVGQLEVLNMEQGFGSPLATH